MNNNDDEDEAAGGRGRVQMRWVGAGLVLAMLGGLVWQAVEAGRAGVPVEEDEVLVEDLAHPDRIDMLAQLNETQLAQQGVVAMAAALKASGVPALAADETELCGVGRVKADENGQPRDMAPVRAAAQRLRAQVLPVLLDSRDDVTRAAGLLMVAAAEGPAAGGAAGGLAGSATRARDELASMAASRSTPQVYAWAMRACQRQRDEGTCRMLSSEQWARLEPGNAYAWLHVAADAQLRRDEAAVAEAMYRVSQAPRSNSRHGVLASTVLSRLPPEADLLSRIGLATELFEVDLATEVPLVAAGRHCGAGEVLDANRQQVCVAVAELLHQRSSTLVEAVLGASIGKRAGWSAERVALASEERDALSQVGQATQQVRNPWACDVLARDLARFHDIARQGELASMRAALKRSTEGVAVLARRYRESTAMRVASAASAASAAQ